MEELKIYNKDDFDLAPLDGICEAFFTNISLVDVISKRLDNIVNSGDRSQKQDKQWILRCIYFLKNLYLEYLAVNDEDGKVERNIKNDTIKKTYNLIDKAHNALDVIEDRTVTEYNKPIYGIKTYLLEDQIKELHKKLTGRHKQNGIQYIECTYDDFYKFLNGEPTQNVPPIKWVLNTNSAPCAYLFHKKLNERIQENKGKITKFIEKMKILMVDSEGDSVKLNKKPNTKEKEHRNYQKLLEYFDDL